MTKRVIRTEQDLADFYAAFSRRDLQTTFEYLTQDCVWDASEKRMQGQAEMREYWTGDHAAIKETLGDPQNMVFGKDMAYVQVLIRLEFTADGTFMGHPYAKGTVLEVPCVDVYTFTQEGGIKECRVYPKFHPPEPNAR